MVQDHAVYENVEVFRLGRVLGRQKNRKTIKKLAFSKKNSENLDEIGQILVSRALDRTKSIRKTAADIFAKPGLEKPRKNDEKSNFSPGFSPFFPWI